MKIISVHGDIDKVENLLQGLITSDIKLLANENFQLSSICNQKGEVMAGFVIHKSKNYKIVIDEALVDTFIDELRPFAKFFGVTFSVVNSFVYGHITPEKKDKAFFSNDIFSLSLSMEKEMCINNPALLKNDWIVANRLALNFDLSIDDVGKYRPLEINYDKSRVAFDKGCFRGQEIIARMKYLGVDRRKFVTIVSSEAIKENKNFKVIGEILRYKDFYIFCSSIKRGFLDEFSSINPTAFII
jgi:folate-binding protein YgfZ